MSQVIGLTAAEVVAKGKEIYLKLKATVDPGNDGKFVAIDVLSGDFEIGTDILATARRLKARHHVSDLYTKRIGYEAAVSLGGRSKRDKESPE